MRPSQKMDGFHMKRQGKANNSYKDPLQVF